MTELRPVRESQTAKPQAAQTPLVSGYPGSAERQALEPLMDEVPETVPAIGQGLSRAIQVPRSQARAQ